MIVRTSSPQSQMNRCSWYNQCSPHACACRRHLSRREPHDPSHEGGSDTWQIRKAVKEAPVVGRAVVARAAGSQVADRADRVVAVVAADSARAEDRAVDRVVAAAVVVSVPAAVHPAAAVVVAAVVSVRAGVAAARAAVAAAGSRAAAVASPRSA